MYYRSTAALCSLWIPYTFPYLSLSPQVTGYVTSTPPSTRSATLCVTQTSGVRSGVFWPASPGHDAPRSSPWCRSQPCPGSTVSCPTTGAPSEPLTYSTHGWPLTYSTHGWPLTYSTHGSPLTYSTHVWGLTYLIHGWPTDLLNSWMTSELLNAWLT